MPRSLSLSAQLYITYGDTDTADSSAYCSVNEYKHKMADEDVWSWGRFPNICLYSGAQRGTVEGICLRPCK